MPEPVEASPGGPFAAARGALEPAAASPATATLDPASRARSPAKADKTRWTWRGVSRALHRDAGYLGVGLTLVYAVSGIAVNHISDWDPNFESYQRTHELGGPLQGDDAAISSAVRDRLGISEATTDVYRASPDQLEIVLRSRTLHVDTNTGSVFDEGQKPRLLLRAANWLHLNRGKKAWTYFADAYAGALLLLVVTGVTMVPGRKGLFGRGGLFMVVGAAIPIAYVALSGGP